MVVPKIIFIVPYRSREEHMFFFNNYIKYIMEDYDHDEWEVYFAHQKDNREFNRGGMKNIGFLAMKEKYPDDYKNITFVFNICCDFCCFGDDFKKASDQHDNAKFEYSNRSLRSCV